MTNYSELRLLSPEIIWLETEDFQRASQFSNGLATEQQRWQDCLNLLAVFGLKTWLTERISNHQISLKIDVASQIYWVQVGDFTITAIAVTNLLSETVILTEAQLQDSITHFYAVLEISEEAEEATFRGILRRDHLESYLANQEIPKNNRNYSFPLSCFDPEPNHLISYCQYLTPDAIIAPANEPTNSPVTELSLWLQDTIITGWSAIESLINPEMSLALSTRSISQEVSQKGKLIQLGEVSLILAIAVYAEPEAKLGILVQLYPANPQQILPEGLNLTLRSKTGKNLQSVSSRQADNYIQLRKFRGKQGKCFSLEFGLENIQVIESFQL